MFVRLHRKLCETGSFLASTSDADRARTARTAVVIQEISDTVKDQPCTSIRGVGRNLRVPQSTTWKMMKGCRPTIFKRVQALIAADYPCRVDLARWVLQHSAVRLDFTATVFIKDENTFKHDGVFKTNNEHVWPNVNPPRRLSTCASATLLHHCLVRNHRWQPISTVSSTGIPWRGKIPYVSPRLVERSAHSHQAAYVVPARWRTRPLCRGDVKHMDLTLPGRSIGRGGPIASPPRLPNLSGLNFFLWG